MGNPVGGDPASIEAAGARLHRTSGAVGDRSGAIHRATSDAGGACDDARLAGALARFGAAYGQFTTDVGVELRALGTLVSSTGADLRTAGGGR